MERDRFTFHIFDNKSYSFIWPGVSQYPKAKYCKFELFNSADSFKKMNYDKTRMNELRKSLHSQCGANKKNTFKDGEMDVMDPHQHRYTDRHTQRLE